MAETEGHLGSAGDDAQLQRDAHDSEHAQVQGEEQRNHLYSPVLDPRKALWQHGEHHERHSEQRCLNEELRGDRTRPETEDALGELPREPESAECPDSNGEVVPDVVDNEDRNQAERREAHQS